MTDETFRSFQGFDLGPVDADPEHDPASPKVFRVLKTTTVREMTGRVATDLGQPPEKVRLWVVVNRQNKTLRPESCLDQPDMTVDDANMRHGAKYAGFRVWAEVTKEQQDGAPLWPDMSTQNNGNPPTLIFLKYFDVRAQSLKGVGSIYFPRRGKVSELVAPILELMGWPDETQLDLFEVRLLQAKPICLFLSCTDLSLMETQSLTNK
jgi:ubiquitin carboxyl-terminal hydrolase 7